VGWGSTWGAINGAMERVQADGRKIAHVQLTHLNPFPANLGEVLRAYDRVLVPEMNLGQLTTMLRARYLVDVQSYARVRGLPINSGELAGDIITMIQELSA
jgi:2-oxoglutarate ferredoxin oxidoreductase subunit alpha